MALLLALDISLKAGWALLDTKDQPAPGVGPFGSLPTLVEYGKITPNVALKEMLKLHGYPWAYYYLTLDQASRLVTLVEDKKPAVIAIEETNKGRARYTQKVLEFLHALFLNELAEVGKGVDPATMWRVVYINSSDWRSNLGQVLSKEDKKSNAKLSKAKRDANKHGETLDKKALGVRGRIGKKHLSVRWVNEHYNLNLKMKDNDEADAICVGTAYYRGAPHSDGVSNF